MLRWAKYLAEAPVVLQRLIAATHRVSVPHRADDAARLAALRQALCRPAAVRAGYFALAPEAQQALQALRQRRGVLPTAAAEQLLGPIRSLRQLRADRRPQSVGETLVLLGWLLPRPARPRHPAGWVLAPELRRWLPLPLPEAVPSARPSALPSAQVPVALAATYALLAAAAEQPLPLRANGLLASAALRRLRVLGPVFVDDGWQWLAPLLVDLQVLRLSGQTLRPGPALARFAGAAATEQLGLLRTAWEGQPRADRWLARLRLSTRGLDWPAFRRRLLRWGEAMAAQRFPDADAAFVALTAALGPLVDATTHCLLPVRRAPWSRRGQQQAWRAAVAGPLAWLGVVTPFWLDPALPWRFDAASGQIVTPIAALADDLVVLQPWAKLVAVDHIALRWQIQPATIRQALAAGHDVRALHDLWRRRLGSEPPVWVTPAHIARVRLVSSTLALCDAPETLVTAARRPAVRRALAMQVAPGVAMVAPGGERALARALARVGVAVVAADAAPDRADAYPPRLIQACEPARSDAFDATEAADVWQQSGQVGMDAPSQPRQPLAAMLHMLRAAIRRRQAVCFVYQPPQQPAHERLVQPIRIEQHGDRWLLYAYCAMRRAERCFRIDRITDLISPSQRMVSAHRRGRTAAPKGRLALPSAPPHRLARVWLE